PPTTRGAAGVEPSPASICMAASPCPEPCGPKTPEAPAPTKSHDETSAWACDGHEKTRNAASGATRDENRDDTRAPGTMAEARERDKTRYLRAVIAWTMRSTTT